MFFPKKYLIDLMSRSFNVSSEIKVLLTGDGEVPGERSLTHATAGSVPPQHSSHPAAGVRHISC